ncbi:MAG: outer membrane protein assembly factor BamA, partial [Chlorobiaceae bacterium]|nr:outer membrane protein assembly factor BamA [Chlorobiaceae bacterium]
MKKMQKLITLVLVALAVNATGQTAEAKSKPAKQSVTATQAKTIAEKKELYTISTITFSGLQSLNEQELVASLPIKIGNSIAVPGAELSATMQYLWNLQVFRDIKLEKS